MRVDPLFDADKERAALQGGFLTLDSPSSNRLEEEIKRKAAGKWRGEKKKNEDGKGDLLI